MILGQTTSPLKKEGRFRYFSISIHSGSLICKKTFHYIRDFFFVGTFDIGAYAQHTCFAFISVISKPVEYLACMQKHY